MKQHVNHVAKSLKIRKLSEIIIAMFTVRIATNARKNSVKRCLLLVTRKSLTLTVFSRVENVRRLTNQSQNSKNTFTESTVKRSSIASYATPPFKLKVNSLNTPRRNMKACVITAATQNARVCSKRKAVQRNIFAKFTR